MTGLEALRSVQFVSANGKRFAVIDADDWEALIEWLEDLEDIQIAREAIARLKKAKGNRARLGIKKWADVRDEL
jgi:PHD/YefM family antitoxin component YafN of YafNO toxin-antitoxin module